MVLGPLRAGARDRAIRIKRCVGGVDADLDDLAAFASNGRGVTEILNLELEPVFFGQGLGERLMCVALAHVPADDIVICQPVPTDFSNVPPGESAAKVDAFYRRLGFAPDARSPVPRRKMR